MTDHYSHHPQPRIPSFARCKETTLTGIPLTLPSIPVDPVLKAWVEQLVEDVGLPWLTHQPNQFGSISDMLKVIVEREPTLRHTPNALDTLDKAIRESSSFDAGKLSVRMGQSHQFPPQSPRSSSIHDPLALKPTTLSTELSSSIQSSPERGSCSCHTPYASAPTPTSQNTTPGFNSAPSTVSFTYLELNEIVANDDNNQSEKVSEPPLPIVSLSPVETPNTPQQPELLTTGYHLPPPPLPQAATTTQLYQPASLDATPPPDQGHPFYNQAQAFPSTGLPTGYGFPLPVVTAMVSVSTMWGDVPYEVPYGPYYPHPQQPYQVNGFAAAPGFGRRPRTAPGFQKQKKERNPRKYDWFCSDREYLVDFIWSRGLFFLDEHVDSARRSVVLPWAQGITQQKYIGVGDFLSAVVKFAGPDFGPELVITAEDANGNEIRVETDSDRKDHGKLFHYTISLATP